MRGHRGCTAQTCVLRPQTSPRLLPRQVPGLPRGYGRPRPPHSPLGTGSAWLPQPQDAQSACVRVCLAWGRGSTGRAESRGAQAQSAPSLRADPQRAMGVAGARGPAPRRPPPAPYSSAAAGVGSSGSGLRRCLAPSDQDLRVPMPWSREARGAWLLLRVCRASLPGAVGSVWVLHARFDV